ncbi:MAG TPA: FHA domain-containing protein [Anaerolineae bacterium]|nr:FHA domain-containing protein [Anaerolineae bacterium]
MSKLQQLERYMRWWVERGWRRWLKRPLTLDELFLAVEAELSPLLGSDNGAITVEIRLNPADLAYLVAKYELLGDLIAAHVAEWSERCDRSWQVDVLLLGQTSVWPYEVDVSLAANDIDLASTKNVPAVADPLVEQLTALDAFLVVPGQGHVSLQRFLTTVGRGQMNDIVVMGAAVSRQHAQIRWQGGYFVWHDLGSLGGTEINGVRITTSVLQAGDRITLGGMTTLLYSEGVDGWRAQDNGERGETQPWSGSAV